MALMQSGRILELQGKTDEARAKYRELVAKFPNSIFSGEAKARAGQ
jgi:TolA-binding protein